MSLYLEVHQTRDAAPTVAEDLLGDALEHAYARGIDDIDGIVAHLNMACVPAANGAEWTADSLKAELKRLGA